MITRSARPPKTPSQPPWPSRSHVTVFVRCLHLLDLDQLEDWPSVSENIFTAKNAQQTLQQRVKAVEWSLYRLFEIYDPDETQDKLRPFFPPAAPLQSLNLRAALYRCLTELKKNGVLGKDILLRKTMLDDCKGERFEEVIANFAVIVLRKSSPHASTQTERKCTDSQLLPMTLAYRKSLQNNLKNRAEIQTQTKQEQRRLSDAKANLLKRLEEVSSRSFDPNPEEQKDVRALVNGNWIGGSAWTDILLHGAPFENELDDHGSDSADFVAHNSRSLLRNFDDRISKHQSRLSEWKLIAKDLKARQKLNRPTTDPKPVLTEGDTLIQFSQHMNLNLGEWKESHVREVPMDESYSRLLDAMKRELTSSSKRTSSFEKKQVTWETTAENTNQLPETVMNQVQSSDDDASVLEAAHRNVNLDQTFDLSIATEENRSMQSSPVSNASALEDSFSMPEQPSSITTAAEPRSIADKESGHVSVDFAEEQAASPTKAWMSLAERTRASIALTGRQSILPDPDSPILQSTKSINVRNTTVPDLQLSSDDERRTTLLERTRKSMLLFSTNNTTSTSRSNKRKSEHKRTSQIYPVNQFETPRRPTPQNLDVPTGNTGTGSGSSTPREKLFDEDAEYASVFKSRPKIALSPAFSPRRSGGVGLDSVLEDSMQNLDLDSD